MEIRRRKVGFFKQNTQPTYIIDTTVNGINLYSQMKELKSNGGSIYEKYQKIIHELETMVHDLQRENSFLHHERQQLLQENINLRKKMENSSSWVKTNEQIIKIQGSEMQHVYHLEDESKEILESSHIEDMLYGVRGEHEIHDEISYDSAEKKQKQNSQKTPNLGKSSQICAQCKNYGNQSPLRVFYLLLLQNKSEKLMDMLISIIQELDVDPTHQLFPLYKDNSFWMEFIKGFVQNVRKGVFYDEADLLNYLNNNQLIDYILISALKSRLSFMNEKDTNNQSLFIDHHEIYLGLANQFNLRMEQLDSQYLFFPQIIEEQSQAIDGNFSLEISLNDRTRMVVSNARKRQEPLFKVSINKDRKVYEFMLNIKYQQNQVQPYSHEFKESEEEDISSKNSQGIKKYGMSASVPSQFEGPLRDIDMNQRKSRVCKYVQSQDSYLYQDGYQSNSQLRQYYEQA